MKIITLTNCTWPVFVDDEDYDVLAQWKWRGLITPNTMYAVTFKKRGSIEQTFMHRLLRPSTGQAVCDHLNSIGTCNFRSNLELLDNGSLNSSRQKPQAFHSIYRGIAPLIDGWEAWISHRGERVDLGQFKTEIEAALAYDARVRELHGDFSIVNFPNEWQLRNIPHYALTLDKCRANATYYLPRAIRNKLTYHKAAAKLIESLGQAVGLPTDKLIPSEEE
jgi:hypothetical protein